ncbi:hypothetical protein [Bradyrhizobium sp. SZCCHNS1012]|uniref:hypothetical protein n=1 Tax=Bradyrhizobium sp. SZCCHNS1012 TaxID=3057297 RepID=UPI002916D39E|nr:hypothetical protein [Bradyrhizobium sp. SZCCHNS1012]
MEVLFSAYRRDQYASPDGFMTQAALVLSEYSEDVVRYVTDPRTGIQRKLKWPPVIAELVEACDHAKQMLPAMRQKAEMAALGFQWTNDPANHRIGYYNAEGVRWQDRHKPRLLARPSRPATAEQMAELQALLAMQSARREPAHEPVNDGRHHARVAADLASKKARNVAREA